MGGGEGRRELNQELEKKEIPAGTPLTWWIME